jgi:hypothetical protein
MWKDGILYKCVINPHILAQKARHPGKCEGWKPERLSRISSTAEEILDKPRGLRPRHFPG